MVNNIDVTLRDGGYLNNFNFTTEYAINHVETLTKSGMEWFEIGYRNGSFKPISNIGLTGMSPDSYIWDIHRAVPEAKLVVIAHPHNINADDIHAMLYNKGFPQHQIAESLGVHSSTVSRELKRNANNKQYCAKSAEILKNNRKKTAFKFKKYHPRHENILSEGLSMGWSPENIDYRMRLECPEIALSHSTLYRRIREDRDARGALYKRLPRFGKTRWKGGKRKAGQSHIPNRVDISQRPAIVDKRARIGDFEWDTIYGQNAYLVTLVDRKSRLLLMAKTQDRTAEAVSNVMNTLLNRVSSVHTVTLDNGGEFARHEKVSQSTKAQIYFARPYASYQRGTNENTNGLVRRQWPKGTAFGSLTEQDVSELELRLNMTPRKVLNGLTPIEAYTGRTLHLLC